MRPSSSSTAVALHNAAANLAHSYSHASDVTMRLGDGCWSQNRTGPGVAGALLAAAGGPQQMVMVAGARYANFRVYHVSSFEPALFFEAAPRPVNQPTTYLLGGAPGPFCAITYNTKPLFLYGIPCCCQWQL